MPARGGGRHAERRASATITTMVLASVCAEIGTPTTGPCRDQIVQQGPRSSLDYVVDFAPYVLCAVAVGALIWALVRHRRPTAFAISLLLALGFAVL
jgi:hypothetical protein